MKLAYSTLLVSMACCASCSNASRPNDPVPEHETLRIASQQVGETRVINIWTPPGYSSQTDSLPVIYMADGGIKEDFPHLANTLATLIGAHKIKPVILVGIENTQRRRDLTGYTEVASDKKIAPVVGGSEKFRNFVQEELFPEISKRYRTNGHKSIIGESAAGLFVMETFFLNPELFDNYIAFDPSLWWNNHYLVRTAREHLSQFPSGTAHRLWFAGSDAQDVAPHTQALAAIFRKEQHPGITWHYADKPQEKHTTIFRASKEEALIWTFGTGQ